MVRNAVGSIQEEMKSRHENLGTRLHRNASQVLTLAGNHGPIDLCSVPRQQRAARCLPFRGAVAKGLERVAEWSQGTRK